MVTLEVSKEDKFNSVKDSQLPNVKYKDSTNDVLKLVKIIEVKDVQYQNIWVIEVTKELSKFVKSTSIIFVNFSNNPWRLFSLLFHSILTVLIIELVKGILIIPQFVCPEFFVLPFNWIISGHGLKSLLIIYWSPVPLIIRLISFKLDFIRNSELFFI